ncbi:MAG: O-methyltransferase [Bauldia sp.]|nr:O-methyltransferase [Bauldia sp.]
MPDDAQVSWTAVDRYFEDRLNPPDPILDAAVARSEAAGLPAIQVAPNQGKLLCLLARAMGAKAALEIGTLGGYSTIWLGRAVAPSGRVLSLELSEAHARVARTNLDEAGLSAVAEVRVGPALDSLADIAAKGAGPFDLVFIDADKANIPDYFDWSMKLTRPGSLIVIDNVVRDGEVAEAASADPSVRAIRQLNDRLKTDARVSATTIQTVGVKGYDGFTLILVL